eukprot:3782338-Rhodomonas_salina.1
MILQRQYSPRIPLVGFTQPRPIVTSGWDLAPPSHCPGHCYTPAAAPRTCSTSLSPWRVGATLPHQSTPQEGRARSPGTALAHDA